MIEIERVVVWKRPFCIKVVLGDSICSGGKVGKSQLWTVRTLHIPFWTGNLGQSILLKGQWVHFLDGGCGEAMLYLLANVAF